MSSNGNKDSTNIDNSIILERQLHEQYAINNNSNLSSVIALIVGLLAVLGAYGHVLINTNGKFSGNFLFKESDYYTLEALIVVTIASLFVLYIIWSICLYQGVAQRREQFIIYAIRIKHYGGITNYNKAIVNKNGENVKNGENNENDETPIFRKEYSPFNKKGLNIVQGLYGKVMCFSLITSIGLASMTLFMIVQPQVWCKMFFCFLIICLVLLFVAYFCRWKKEEKRYNEYLETYEQYNPY